VAKALVEAHAGTIAVNSRAGGGTQFTVTLPAPGAADASNAAPPKAHV
jgi:signal transduction histidine kinase